MTFSTRLSLLERVRETASGESWRDFCDVYDHLILGWLAQQGVSYHDAEDIRQEVMSTVSQELAQFEHNGRPGAFRAWLRRITANRMHRHWQKRKARDREGGNDRLAELSDELADESSNLTAVWDRQYNRVVVDRLINQLRGRFAEKSIEAFRRVVLNEEDARHVADALGMTLGAVRVAQHRVLHALKSLGEGLVV
ncbi:MAG: sigma-70 family RNA polymerase sigma factor [Planctomycetales bacterium]|nr:sigma-70 family RNA polymerase sigma factor [Planctomycetales bacterium]